MCSACSYSTVVTACVGNPCVVLIKATTGDKGEQL